MDYRLFANIFWSNIYIGKNIVFWKWLFQDHFRTKFELDTWHRRNHKYEIHVVHFHTFQVNICSHFFQRLDKGSWSKWTSSSSAVCSPSTAHTSLCRDHKYLLEIRYIILVYPNVTRFFIFNTVFFYCRMETLLYIWK